MAPLEAQTQRALMAAVLAVRDRSHDHHDTPIDQLASQLGPPGFVERLWLATSAILDATYEILERLGDTPWARPDFARTHGAIAEVFDTVGGDEQDTAYFYHLADDLFLVQVWLRALAPKQPPLRLAEADFQTLMAGLVDAVLPLSRPPQSSPALAAAAGSAWDPVALLWRVTHHLIALYGWCPPEEARRLDLAPSVWGPRGDFRRVARQAQDAFATLGVPQAKAWVDQWTAACAQVPPAPWAIHRFRLRLVGSPNAYTRASDPFRAQAR